MGRARVGVPPGERRLRAAHVERVGAAAVGAGGGVIAGNAGWGRGLQTGGPPPAESSVDDGTIFPQPARGSRVVEKYLEHAPRQWRAGEHGERYPHANPRQMDGRGVICLNLHMTCEIDIQQVESKTGKAGRIEGT